MVRGTLSRQKRGRWSTTVANAWGTVALARFAGALRENARERPDHHRAR
jgi:hypothetical protein